MSKEAKRTKAGWHFRDNAKATAKDREPCWKTGTGTGTWSDNDDDDREVEL